MIPILIGIAGPSGAGKSTVTKLIEQENENILRIKLDNYFKDINTFDKVKKEIYWDVPEKINFDLLYENLSNLKSGKRTKIPTFSKTTLKRNFEVVDPKPLILVEGFLLYFDEKVRDLLDVKIYIDISDEMTLKRRIKRESPERSDYIKEVVIPNYKKYGLPTKKFADYVLDGSKNSEDLKDEILRILSQSSSNQQF